MIYAATEAREVGVAAAMNKDLIDLGKRSLTPYHRLKPQLDAMMTLARETENETERSVILNDRQHLLTQLHNGVLSGFADDLTEFSYWDRGRRSPEGLCREIIERAKHAGEVVPLAELRLIVTAGNSGKVHADLQEVLGTLVDPTVATSPGASAP